MPEAPRRQGWLPILGRLGGLVLGGVLVYAAWAKVVDPKSFVELVAQEGLDFLLPAEVVAPAAVALEAGLGLALFLGVRRLWVLIPTTALVAFFIFLTARAYWNDVHGLKDAAVTCGCFGNLVDHTPAEAFWRDLFLLVPGLVLSWLGRGERVAREATRVLVTASFVVLVLIFGGISPSLPLDDYATRLHPGKTLGQVCTGRDRDRMCLEGILLDAKEGRHVVAIVALRDPAFAAAVGAWNDYVIAGRGPELWVLTEHDPAHTGGLMAFEAQHAPAFKILEAPHALLRPLYRSLPRSFLLHNGEVIRTWSGMPPLEDLVAPEDADAR